IPIPPQPSLRPGVRLAPAPQVVWSKSAPQQALQQPAPTPPAPDLGRSPSDLEKERWRKRDEQAEQRYRDWVPRPPANTAFNANLALECGAAKSTPPDNDPDPIYKTKIVVTDQVVHVVHYAASGETFIRNEQYRDQRFWAQQKTHNWSGVSVKHPDRTMVGSIQMDKDGQRGEYTEKLFRSGTLQATIVSVCRPIPAPTETRERNPEGRPFMIRAGHTLACPPSPPPKNRPGLEFPNCSEVDADGVKFRRTLPIVDGWCRIAGWSPDDAWAQWEAWVDCGDLYQ